MERGKYVRELKFRAFDTLTNKMIVSGFHIFGEVTMFNLISTYIYEHPGDDKFDSGLEMELKRQDDIVIMQWTGLVDKNKKDIYESDVLEIETANHTRVRMVCKWGTVQRTMDTGWEVDITGFHFYRTDGLAAFPITKNWAGKRDLDMLEIIGNLYENPELLSTTR